MDVWYSLTQPSGDARRVGNGNFYGRISGMSPPDTELREFDLLGNTVVGYYATTDPSPGPNANGALPVHAETFHHDTIKLPLIGPRLPYWIVSKMMKAQRYMTLQPLLGQDVWVIEREQDGWERHWDRPSPELSPVVKAFQDLTIRKWEEYLASRRPNACGPELVAAGDLVR